MESLARNSTAECLAVNQGVVGSNPAGSAMNAKDMMVERLRRGEVILGYREGGNSMTPIIKHRQPVDIHPLTRSGPYVNDVVFCKVGGRYMMHLVTAVKYFGTKPMYQISNNHGHVNGWTTRDKIYGIVSVSKD
jgi:hypothetical protein